MWENGGPRLFPLSSLGLPSVFITCMINYPHWLAGVLLSLLRSARYDPFFISTCKCLDGLRECLFGLHWKIYQCIITSWSIRQISIPPSDHPPTWLGIRCCFEMQVASYTFRMNKLPYILELKYRINAHDHQCPDISRLNYGVVIKSCFLSRADHTNYLLCFAYLPGINVILELSPLL